MRYRKTSSVSLCFLFGAISTFSILFHVQNAALAQDADPFGSSNDSGATASFGVAAESVSDKNVKNLSPDERIHQALREACDLNFDEEAWSDIERELESRYRFNIVLAQSAKDDSLDHDEPVSVNLRGISLGNALRLMLKEKNATFVVQNEILNVISIDDIQDPRYFSRRMVNVNSILEAGNAWHRQQQSLRNHPKNAGMADMGMGMDMGMGGGSGYSSPVVDENELVDLVLHSVKPDAWRNNPYTSGKNMEGGLKSPGMATCSGFCGHLIVSGPEELLDEVEDFLGEVRLNLTGKSGP